jgi:predicted Rossmann-fold nucleotide-binding protein
VRFYFGSARTKPEDILLTCRKIAYKISKAGYGVITGGGPGIMEAGNKGASGRWNFSGIEYCIAV